MLCFVCDSIASPVVRRNELNESADYLLAFAFVVKNEGIVVYYDVQKTSSVLSTCTTVLNALHSIVFYVIMSIIDWVSFLLHELFQSVFLHKGVLNTQDQNQFFVETSSFVQRFHRSFECELYLIQP